MNTQIETIAPSNGIYRVEPTESRIAFEMHHLFGLGRVHGTIDVSGGAVVVGTVAEATTISAWASAASISTHNPVRDLQVKSPLFLGVKKHPEIKFTAAKLTASETGWVAEGVATVKGKDSPVVFTVAASEPVPGGFRVTAKATVDRFKLGVRSMPGMAGRKLDLTATIVIVA
ncbi:MAG: hypothetical protein JWR52_1075 [Marmoricola sp.]|nr:hypothetical protein [Marmoricola sp.]